MGRFTERLRLSYRPKAWTLMKRHMEEAQKYSGVLGVLLETLATVASVLCTSTSCGASLNSCALASWSGFN
jgi:hypothetical protein